MMENPGEWSTSEADEIAWLSEAWSRMRGDVDCASDHWERAKAAADVDDLSTAHHEIYNVVKHIENLGVGVDLCQRILVDRFCSAEMVAQLVVDKIQMQTGEEFKIVAAAVDVDGVGGFLLERQVVDVPDDASELDGE